MAMLAAIEWPTLEALSETLLLRDYNTRVVEIGVTLLGIASGVIGSFMLLRKRALLGDALSHATLPGIMGAFLVATALGVDGKSLPLLLAGATVSGVLGILCILLIVHTTRIKEDAALGIVLSVFFGAGVALSGIIQNLGVGNAAGLNSFIYGKTASMLFSDAVLIASAALTVTVICLVFFKEFAGLCFDAAFLRAQGWPVGLLDMLLMAVVVAVTVIGLQAVGLILMIALLVIPAAAARFWTHHLPTMLVTAAAIGGLSGYLGAAISALLPRMPAGAVIVLVAGAFFGVSMLAGPARGVLIRSIEHLRLSARVSRQHLLRALYELGEAQLGPVTAGDETASIDISVTPTPLRELLAERSWTPRRLRRVIRSARRDGLVEWPAGGDGVALTPSGAALAWRIVRNHRLWELYLITHADIAPSHVDRDADEVEHVLGPEMIRELEALMARETPRLVSPHVIRAGKDE
ncbi:MAG: hypothetical protein AMXMBFR47_18660 [Planctomycetota bacterium]